MNIHIELVKKWLDNPDSVTQQELDDNRDAAYASYTYFAADSAAAYYAANAANAANSAYAAAMAADYATYYSAAADYWVKRYEELTK